MAGTLSGDQVAQYRRDGFLFPVRAISRDDAVAWRSRFESVEARSAMLGLSRPFDEYARMNFHVVSVAAAELARHPALLDLVEPILGPDVYCWRAELVIKEPRSERIFTMHQDATYWGFDHLDHLVTVWLALTDVLESTGGLRYIRASHLAGTLPHTDTYGPLNMLGRGERVDATYWEDDEVPAELAPGEASLHHGLTVHGSGPNITDVRRVGVAFRYVSPHLRPSGSSDAVLTCRGDNPPSAFDELEPPRRDFDAEALDRFEALVRAHDEVHGAGATGEPSLSRGIAQFDRDLSAPEPRTHR